MQASQNVLRHYSVETTQKGADWIALFGVITNIVGFRVGAYKLRMRMEREERRQGQQGNVIQMPGSFPSNVKSAQAPQPAAPNPSPATAPHLSPQVEIDQDSGF